MDPLFTNLHNESVMAAGLLPDGLNVSSLLDVIRGLSPDDRDALFRKLGMGSEDELRQLVGGVMLPAHVASEAERMQYPEYRAHRLLRLYVPPVLLLLGTFGNIFSFLILRHKAMARQSTHHFLAALAVADSLVLYVGLFRKWIGDLTSFDAQTESEWLCKGIVMLGYTCSNVSVWIIVAVTVERYIVVCHPLKATMVCNVTRAQRVVLALAAIFIVINLHFLWTASITWEVSVSGERHSPQCNSEEGHEFLITAVWPWVDALLYGMGPFVIIFVLNIFIIVHVVRATSGRVILQNRCSLKSPAVQKCSGQGCSQYQLVHLTRSTSSGSVNSCNVSSGSSGSSGSNGTTNAIGNVNSGGGGSNSSNNNNNNNKPATSHSLKVPGPPTSGKLCSFHGGASSGAAGGSGRGSKSNRRFTSDSNIRLTVMLLTVSFTFLVTTLPMNVSIIASAFWNRQSDDLARMSKFQLVFTVAEMLMYLNHSVNFFLYCATGQKFRSEMVRMVCGKQRPQAIISDHSQHIFCSRTCVANGFTELRNIDETEL